MLDRGIAPCYNDLDNLITHCVAYPAVKPGMLNKKTGCESRTVPPLYVLMVRSLAKASHWGNPGRPIFTAGAVPRKA